MIAFQNTVKTAKFYKIATIICAALFPAVIYILNNGLYWDDWWVYLHRNEPNFPLWLARDQKAPLQLFFMLSNFYLMDSIYVIRIFTLACWILACLCFAYVLLKNDVVSRCGAYAVALMMLASPFVLGKYVIIVYGCTLTLASFWAAFALMAKKDCTKNRILAYILFFISFGFKSLMFFYAIFLLFLLKVTFLTHPLSKGVTLSLTAHVADMKGSFKRFWIISMSFIKKNYIFILLPILFVIFCEIIQNRPIELYTGYNEIKFEDIFIAIAKTIINTVVLLTTFPQFIVSLVKFGFLYVSFIFFIFLVIFYFLLNKLDFCIVSTKAKALSQILFGAVFLFFGAYPYVLVGHQVAFSGSFAVERHLSVAHFGLILTLFGILNLLFSFFSPSKKVVVFIFSSIIALNTAIACMAGMHYCRDSVIQAGIINNLAHESEYVKQYNLILFKDDAQRTLIRDPMPLRDYEFMGYLEKAGIRRGDIYSCSVYKVEDFGKLHSKNTLKDLALHNFNMLNIRPLYITVSFKQSLTQWKSLWITFLYYVNKARYVEECRKIISLCYTPLFNKVTPSMSALGLISQRLETYKKENGHYPFKPVEKYTKTFYLQPSSSYDVVEQKAWTSSIPWSEPESSSTSFGYEYFSDGVDYKLIANKPLDAIYSLISYPNNYDAKHDSYGYWSDGAKSW